MSWGIKGVFMSQLKKISQITFKQSIYFILLPAVLTYVTRIFSTTLFSWVWQWMNQLSRTSVVSVEQLTSIFNQPFRVIALISLIILLLLMSMQLYLYYFCLVIYYEQISEMTLRESLVFVLKKQVWLMKEKPWVYLLFMLIIIPFDNFLQIQTVFKYILPPLYLLEALQEIFFSSLQMQIGSIILVCLFVIFNGFACIYLYHLIKYQNKEKFIVRHHIWTLCKIFASLLCFIFFAMIIILSIEKLSLWLLSMNTLNNTLQVIIFFVIASFMSLCLPLISSFYTVFVLFVMDWSLDNSREFNNKVVQQHKKRYLFGSLVVIFLLTFFQQNNQLYDLSFNHLNEVEVIAHRGSTLHAPENTLLAFSNALDEGASMIELDVHLTKEGQLVVFHDNDLKRLTGVDVATIDLTQNELNTIRINETHSIPTLESVLSLINHQTKLLIELKTHIETPELEETIVPILEAYGLGDDVLIQSSNLEALQQINYLNPTIKKGLIVSLGITRYNSQYDILDFFSVEQSSLQYPLIQDANKKQKKIFVWTINSNEDLDNVLSYPVKGVITNDTIKSLNRIAYIRLFPHTLWLQFLFTI